MARKRVNLVLSSGMTKEVNELGLELGLDFTNTIRYCIARTVKEEKRERVRAQTEARNAENK